MRDQFLKEPKSPYFRPGTSKMIGRYIVSMNHYAARFFHTTVTCKEIRSNQDLAEIDVVAQHGAYYQAGKLIKVDPCSTCEPLTAAPFRVEPLGTTEVPCMGRDDEWVRSFRNRRPETLVPIQKECVQDCPVVDKCFKMFVMEQPAYGVLGGVTIQQYKAWGDDALETVRELVKLEDQQEEEPATRPRPDGGGGRINRFRGTMERPASGVAGAVRGEGGRPSDTPNSVPVP